MDHHSWENGMSIPTISNRKPVPSVPPVVFVVFDTLFCMVCMRVVSCIYIYSNVTYLIWREIETYIT